MNHSALSLTAALGVAAVIVGSGTLAASAKPLLGVYDPSGAFADSEAIAIEHIYTFWVDYSVESLKDAEEYARTRGRALLVTMEPHTWDAANEPTPEVLLDEILSGEHDAGIKTLCGAIGDFETETTIRWGHAMDSKLERYPWSNWEPSDFIAAYRHVHDVCAAEALDANFMWAPSGRENMEDYYPGDDYVDLIGLSVFALQQYNLDTRGEPGTLVEDLRGTYERVLHHGKPIMVELAFEGDEAFEAAWIEAVREAGEQFPEVEAIVYFNAIDPYPWPEPYGNPDWRVGLELVE